MTSREDPYRDKFLEDQRRKAREELARKMDRDSAKQARELAERWSRIEPDPRPLDAPIYRP